TLDQDADGVAALVGCKLAGGRASAALEAVAVHSGAAADVAFFDRAAPRGVERLKGVLFFDVLPLHVVEPSVGGFGDDGIPERAEAVVFDHPFDCSVANDANAQRVGDQDGRLEHAVFLDPARAGHVAVAVPG